MIEPSRQFQVFRIACDGIDIRYNLHNTAVFSFQYILHLCVCQILEDSSQPVGLTNEDLPGGPVSQH